MKQIIKESRERIDALLEVLKHHQQSREYYKGYDSLQLGFMRLGLLLGVLGSKYPYPDSVKPENNIIEPPTDKAKVEFEMPKLEGEIARVKHFRLTIENEINLLDEKLTEHFGSDIPHEAITAIDCLKDSKMWFGQVLNNIRTAEINHQAWLKQVEENKWKQVKEAYHRYGATTDFKNFQGNQMPEFDALPETIKNAWMAAINPYDPSADISKSEMSTVNSNRCF